jgi:hypothetical protein
MEQPGDGYFWEMRFRDCLFTMTLATGALMLAASSSAAQQQPSGRAQVQLRFDTTEAAVALGIIEWKLGKNEITDDDWKPLFTSDGYRRLKLREAEMQREFTDSSFKAFVLSDTLAKRAVALRAALDKWEHVDVRAAAARALAYLPADAHIAATVYVVLKPRTNTFVYDLERDPSIFVYLDPKQTPAQFVNTIAHELHHIGFASLGMKMSAMVEPLPATARIAAEWTRAFGEGFAMLAAAGGPDVNPHAVSSPADRSRWNSDMTHFNRDLKLVEEFFLGVINGKLATPDDIGRAANEFYGVQGPWYTVGWKMASTIERKYGRPEVIECMIDPYRLFDRYNTAAADYNKTHPTGKLALWSETFVAAMKRP